MVTNSDSVCVVSNFECSDRWCGRGDRVPLTPGNLDNRALQEKGALINLKFDRECPPLYSLKWSWNFRSKQRV
jgi:hypothetical protein